MKIFLFRIAALIRSLPVLHLVRMLHPMPVVGRAVELFDPNEMRKHVVYNAGPRLYLFRTSEYRLYVDLNDHIGHHTFMEREPFEMAVYHFAQLLGLKDGDTILDIGANIGSASVPICAAKNLKLIAVEASAENARLLQRNIDANEVAATLHRLALVAEAEQGDLPLYSNRGNTGANSLKPGRNPSVDDAQVEWVPTAKLDDLLSASEKASVKLCKLDVEGAEYDVLRGASDFLARSNAPILFEYRVDAMKRFLNEDGSNMLNLLRTTRELRSFDGGGLAPFDPEQSYENAVALPFDHPMLEER